MKEKKKNVNVSQWVQDDVVELVLITTELCPIIKS